MPAEAPAAVAPLRHLLVLVLSVLLLLAGAVAVLSASSGSEEALGRFSRHMWHTAAALVVLFACMGVPIGVWRRLAWWSYGIAMALLAAVALAGHEAGGARRWLVMGPAGLQPSEFAKLALVLALAALASSREGQVHRPDRVLRPSLVLMAPMCLLVLAQPDMGTALIMSAIWATMLFVAGVPLQMLLRTVSVLAVLAVAAALAAPYRRARLIGFLDPLSDRTGDGYHTTQSLLGLSRGGLSGTGIGQGQAKWGWLPNSPTDFVFTVIGEETGLVGAVAVLLALFAVMIAAVRIARQAPGRFSSLTAAGIAAWFLAQTAANVGAAVGLLPVTGAPLPFLSFGGSSMMAASAASGALLSAARRPCG